MSESQHTISRKRGVWALLLLVSLVFIYLRPFNSPQQPFIAGDGLGYYSYLPATFIYNDSHYEFRWFNEVHNRYYIHSVFENPEDNLLVDYGNRRINKYYQGLSFIWMPFFALAHAYATIAGVPADGFSAPYQIAVGLASLMFLLAGLYFLEQLLFNLFKSAYASWLVTFCIFSGTHLFPFAINVNSLAHVYSFTLITIFFWLLQRMNMLEKAGRAVPLLLFLYALIVAIRPLDGLIAVAAPAFFNGWRQLRRGHLFAQNTWPWWLAIVGLAAYQLSIMFIQTRSFLPYTYTDERFYFNRSRFFEALFSYHMGLFVYVPVFFIAFLGIPFLDRRKKILLPLLFLLIVYIYASWWFWPITKRGLIDFYAIPALMLGALLSRIRRGPAKVLMGSLLFICAAYYQLKHFQMHTGALDEWRNTGDLFWRNFFRLEKAFVYPVQPSSVLHETHCRENFDAAGGGSSIVSLPGSERNQVFLLDPVNYIARVSSCAYPTFFKAPGLRKIRLSLKLMSDDSLSKIHLLLQFRNAAGEMVKESGFYINEGELKPGKWDYREYGYELQAGDTLLQVTNLKQVDVLVWHVKAKNKVYLDDLQLSFFLTDRSFETEK